MSYLSLMYYSLCETHLQLSIMMNMLFSDLVSISAPYVYYKICLIYCVSNMSPCEVVMTYILDYRLIPFSPHY